MTDIQNTCVIGTGVIGASWAALFLASGRNVAAYDPAGGAEHKLRDYIAKAWPALLDLGLAIPGRSGRLSFCADPAEAAKDADFIQESVPERLPLKHGIFAAIESALKPGAIVASSASGLTLTEMQGGWNDPSPFVLGHPFNPPHLIPLVEIMGNSRTGAGVVDKAERFYQAVGKVTIRVHREVPGHVANRLQAALWREAIHLVDTGVASVEDVDKAVSAGPGLRWAVMGPTMLFHLAAGEGGLAAFCQRYSESFNRWWDDLGVPHLDSRLAEKLAAGVREEAAGRGQDSLSAERDAMLASILKIARGKS